MITKIRKLFYLIGLFFSPASPWYIKLLMLCGFVYLVVPFDFLTDNIPFVGLLDDLGILTIIGWTAYKFLPDELKALLRNHFRS